VAVLKIRCAWSPLAEVLAEPNAGDMIRAYTEELSPLRDLIPVNPDWSLLQRLEAEGSYRIWACRVDSTLAGFLSFLIAPHHDYKDTLFAYDYGHWLSPAYRNTPGQVGLKMWRSVEPALRELGVSWVMAHDGQRSLMPFMLRLGYHPFSTLYWRCLDEP